jgi:glycosyltransferase involved in cell wall biosynthesis
VRIGIDATACLASSTGVGVTVTELTRALLALPEDTSDERLRLCAFSTGGGARDRLHAAFPTDRAEIRTRRLPVRLIAPILDRFSWPDVELLFGAMDVFHAGPLVVPTCRSAALVVTVYDLTPIRFPEYHIPSNSFDRATLRRRLDRAVRIMVPSACTRDDLESLARIGRDRVRVIPLGVREKFRRTSEAPPGLPVGLGLRGEYILTVGSLEPRKNLDRLVRAFKLLKDRHHVPHQLVVVGPKGWLEGGLRETIQSLGLSSEVCFPGFVSDEVLNAFYCNAAVLVYPSLYEGFGLPAVEAMAAGCPVALSRAGSLPEVGGNAAVYFDPSGIEDIAQSTLKILESADLRSQLVNCGLVRSRLFDWGLTARATRDVYAEAMRDR